jgi:tetratricopeptide (TPR) repeat protein
MNTQTRIYRGMALVRKANSLGDAGKEADAVAVANQAAKIFNDLRASGDQSDEVATGLALAITAKISLGSLGETRTQLEKATGLLRPIVAAGRAPRSTKLALADMLQYLAHSQSAEEGLVSCEESRKLLAEIGALDQSDLTAASIYGDVTDTQSRMALKLGQLDEAQRLAGLVSTISEKVLEQRPGDLRAMRNRYYSANVMALVARDRHDLDKAELNFSKSVEAATNYIRFNPADNTGWFNLTTALRDVGLTAFEQGKVAAGLAKLREATALEFDPRNKTGTNFFTFVSWRTTTFLEAQAGNLPAARAAVVETSRTADVLLRERDLDREVKELSALDRKLMYEVDILAAAGDYASVHARAVAYGEELDKIKEESTGNQRLRGDALRRARLWQIESALRLGKIEEAVNVARTTVDRPPYGSLEKLDQAYFLARAQVRLGQALVEAGRRDEALAPLTDAMAYYRRERAAGADDVQFRQDFARALYVLGEAQGTTPAGRGQRRALLDEAAAELGDLSFEAQQLATSKELMRWVAAAQAEAGG